MGKKNKRETIVEFVNFIDKSEYIPFVHNLQESMSLSEEFIDKLINTEDGLKELKKYCGIDESFRVGINKETIETCIQMSGPNILLQVWAKLNIYDNENKLISRGETFYFDIENGKISLMDLFAEQDMI